MKTIVVGFDGSNASLVAVDWAAERAARGVTRVEIVTIGGTILSDESRIDASPRAVEQAAAADLLVVGAHRNGAGSSMRSAHFLRLAVGSTVPIVVVPEHWSPSGAAVVVGFSGHETHSRAVDVAAGEADATGLSLAMVHAWQMPVPRVEGPISLRASPIQVRSEHSKLLRSSALRLAAAFPDISVEQVLSHGDTAGVLVERARDASLMVIGMPRHDILPDALGSIAHELLSHSAVPVCVVPNTNVAT